MGKRETFKERNVTDAADSKKKEDRLFGDISAAQVIATALASVTSMLLSSYIGIAGSVIGVAVASIVSTLAASAYKKFLRDSAEKIKELPLPAIHDGATKPLFNRTASDNAAADGSPVSDDGPKGNKAFGDVSAQAEDIPEKNDGPAASAAAADLFADVKGPESAPTAADIDDSNLEAALAAAAEGASDVASPVHPAARTRAAAVLALGKTDSSPDEDGGTVNQTKTAPLPEKRTAGPFAESGSADNGKRAELNAQPGSHWGSGEGETTGNMTEARGKRPLHHRRENTRNLIIVCVVSALLAVAGSAIAVNVLTTGQGLGTKPAPIVALHSQGSDSTQTDGASDAVNTETDAAAGPTGDADNANANIASDGAADGEGPNGQPTDEPDAGTQKPDSGENPGTGKPSGNGSSDAPDESGSDSSSDTPDSPAAGAGRPGSSGTAASRPSA